MNGAIERDGLLRARDAGERGLRSAIALLRAGTVAFERPDRIPRSLGALAKWGPSLVGVAAAAAAARYPERVALIDDDGSRTYEQLWRRTNALAAGLAGHGIGPGSVVGVMCRNHIGFVEVTLAAARTGADVVFLNTGFAGPQVATVVADERIGAIAHDDEFAPLVASSGVQLALGPEAVAAMAAAGSAPPLAKQPAGRLIILTSGTTGRPKGAARAGGAQTGGLDAATGLLERIPLRLGDRTVIAAPLFHAWGLGNLGFALSLCSTVVLSRHFDPVSVLETVEQERATVLVVVPVMLRRLLAVGDEMRTTRRCPSLRIIASSGSAIGAQLVTDVLDNFGDVLYNVYGSTEVTIATIATPTDLRAEPSTAGRPTLGTTVAIYASDRPVPVPQGETGRVFVGNRIGFGGYTDGASKESIDGLLATGDVGHFDAEGRVFIDGREDDMIVSGGENVYPRQVEDLLMQHPAVEEAAVIGATDAEFGQRLVAFVVREPKSRLTASAVKAFARERLARYEVPRDVVFLRELPRNATGKVLRKDLRPPE